MTELYHAKLKSKVKDVLSKGIVPGKRSAYTGMFAEIKDTGKIYAFTNFDDAVRWASKMNFDFQKPTVIVVFKDDVKKWQKDVHFESAMAKGKWIKRSGSISPKNIVKIIDVTQDMTRAVVKTLFKDIQLHKDGKIR